MYIVSLSFLYTSHFPPTFLFHLSKRSQFDFSLIHSCLFHRLVSLCTLSFFHSPTLLHRSFTWFALHLSRLNRPSSCLIFSCPFSLFSVLFSQIILEHVLSLQFLHTSHSSRFIYKILSYTTSWICPAFHWISRLFQCFYSIRSKPASL